MKDLFLLTCRVSPNEKPVFIVCAPDTLADEISRMLDAGCIVVVDSVEASGHENA